VRDPNPSPEHGRDLAGANLFLRIRVGAEPTADAFAGLTIMQSDPEHVHVLMLTLIYIPDGLYLPPFCGAYRFFSTDIIFLFPTFNSLRSSISPGNGVWNK
jgi:hypothetical protein